MEQSRTTIRTLLISTGIVSMAAVTLKLSLPITLDIFTAEPPQLWSSFAALPWLRPPYLYLIVNCIIVSIVASSKLQFAGVGGAAAAAEFVAVVEKAAAEATEVEEEVEVVKEVVFGYVERKDVAEKTSEIVAEEAVAVAAEVAEKPPVSARFGPRKASKSSPQGKTALKKVSRPKRQETLESTWRTLTEGRSMPLTRHLRKSETFTVANPSASPPVRVMQKSETFSAAGSDAESRSPGSGKLRREPSLSQDDLNRRVEAFIKKFNEEMRLQRLQESLHHYQQPKFSYETVSQ
ncbi:hypothetical protein vseg_007529 [Gypsophila vaccaria]